MILVLFLTATLGTLWNNPALRMLLELALFESGLGFRVLRVYEGAARG